MALALLWRRRAPLMELAVTVAATAGPIVTRQDPPGRC